MKTGAESLLMHILENNHIVYDILKETEEAATPLCCAYCKNPNATILGYCSNLMGYICLGCIGQPSAFAQTSDWENAYTSWTPLILCKEFSILQKCVPKKYPCEQRCSTANYPYWLNAKYIHEVQSSVPKNRMPRISTSTGTIKGLCANCCSFECPPPGTFNAYRVGQCLAVCLGKKSTTSYDAIIIYSTPSKLIINISGANQNTFPSSCTLDLQHYTFWAAPYTYPIAAGRLLMENTTDSDMLNAFTAQKPTESFADLRVSGFDRIHLSDNERVVLGNGVRRATSIFECGENEKRQAGKSQE